MRRHRLAALVFAAALAPALRAAEEAPLPRDLPAFGPDRPLPVPAITQTRLPEGLPVWLVKRRGFPKVTALLVVRGGTASDPKELPGISELLADTLKEGTAARSSRKIAEELQAVGGELSANATEDAIYLSVNGLASGTAQLLAILADVARSASFPASEVALAKANALENLKVRTSTPEFLAEKAFAAAVYGEHPYSVVAPTERTLEAATPEILRREFTRRFRPDRALLVVTGDFETAAAQKTLEKAFAGWKAQGPPPAETPDSPGATARRLFLVNRPGSVQSLLMVGRPTMKATDPDYYPLLVSNTIFGGAFASRLTKNIREDKGYTYSPRSQAATREKGGLLQARADVRNEVTAASLLEIFYELDRMAATRATDEEVARAKRYQAGLYLLRNQIQGAVAQTLARNWVNGLPPEALAEFVPKVNGVTADQIRNVGRKLFTSAQQTVVVVGDAQKVKADLAQFGTVSELQ